MLLAGIAGWAGLSALRSGGRPWPLAALCLACAVAWAAGHRAAGTPAAPVVPGVVAAAGVVALAVPGFWAELRSPLGPPLGYANANAALFVQAGVAALMLLALSKRPWPRVAAGMLAGVFAVVPALIGSVAGSILAAGVAGAAPLRRARWVPPACGLALVLAFVATIAVGALSAERRTLPTAMERLVEGNRRAVLWGEAFSIMVQRPLWGAGPGRFAETAPTALADPDAGWAHNAFLQQGSETGVPGLVLLAALFAWALGQTAGERHRADAIKPGSPSLRVIGAAGVTALGMHATVDYVLHFPAVAVAGALLAGFAAGHMRPPSGFAGSHVQRPGGWRHGMRLVRASEAGAR